MRNKNLAVLTDTLAICEKGYYICGSVRVNLTLSKDRMKAAQVYEPWQVEKLRKEKRPEHSYQGGTCSYSVVNTDSFSLARKVAADNPGDKVLVLNLANSTHIGGGVRHGAKAQEEDLCRQSSLLVALEGENAAGYYEYNRKHKTDMGSDALIVVPEVEIIKDADYEYLDHTTVVSVITCAAPVLRSGPPSDEGAYRQLMYHRIEGILVAAAYHGYKRLVLGAFGCGAFNNDAVVVAEIFFNVIKKFSFDGAGVNDLFKSIDFAVLTKPDKTYNYDEFNKYFGDHDAVKHQTEDKKYPSLGFIGFWHEYENYGFLSNWYKAEFEYAGKHFTSVEQFMMYHKLMTFHQFDLADKVMATNDPAEAKKLGRTPFSNFDDKLWTRISPVIVKRGVRAKFEQNPGLLKQLLATGNAVLAECSPYDKIWGIGLAFGDQALDTFQWKGKNLLGRILMVLREEFGNWVADPNRSIPSYIDVRELPPIPAWEMNTGMLKMVPQYHDAIDAYSATLKGPEVSDFYAMSFSGLEQAMRTNMGGGMPVIGFYEMKQEIYDISRRLPKELI